MFENIIEEGRAEYQGRLDRKLAEIRKGLGSGVADHTLLRNRLLCAEAKDLAGSLATVKALTLSTDELLEAVKSNPAILDRSTPFWTSTLRVVLEDEVKLWIENNIFEQLGLPIVAAQWSDLKGGDLIACIERHAPEISSFSGKRFAILDQIESSEDLAKVFKTLEHMQGEYTRENSDYEYVQELREIEEFLDIRTLIQRGALEEEAILVATCKGSPLP